MWSSSAVSIRGTLGSLLVLSKMRSRVYHPAQRVSTSWGCCGREREFLNVDPRYLVCASPSQRIPCLRDIAYDELSAPGWRSEQKAEVEMKLKQVKSLVKCQGEPWLRCLVCVCIAIKIMLK